MKTYTQEQLKEILDKHQKWLRMLEGGERADLSWANLSRADLSWANLSRADLSRADLSEANLYRANLSEANLSRANLYRANLSEANLSDANLSRADLSDADLINTKKLPCFQICPEIGAFTVFKKLRKNMIATLEITATAVRVNSTGRKCRASEALVLSIESGTEFVEEGASTHDPDFKYKVGEIVSVSDFCDDIRQECAPGIHFFLTRKEAEDY